ncbi:MAG: carboxypeptidase-like regulatory domain-containing protein [Bacteroidales bacterium]|nr:carboxypeptidase-like regulatory domain-containing protein [Bacteroidales bacterium]
MVRRGFILLLLLAMAGAVSAQEVLVLKGRVVDGREGVPYATLQLTGSTIGVCCNDQGDYELKVPMEHRGDSVLVRSVGYEPLRLSVNDLSRRGRIRLKSQTIELREVNVSRYRHGLDLMLDVLRSLENNFQQQKAYSTFFYRDWRAVDDEIYLFDEAVMEVERSPYNQYVEKRSFNFKSSTREMETNYKTILRHRLLVNDRSLLKEKVGKEDGIDEMMQYADEELFYDPVAAPNASYGLSRGMLMRQQFLPLMEFDDGGEGYYLVRSVGTSRLSRETNYEYVIRKRGLALVRITSWITKPVKKLAPEEAWVKVFFTHMAVEADSTTWIYDEREGKLTLTRYYTSNTLRLTSKGRGHDGEEQVWRHSVDWTLTAFASEPTATEGDTLGSRPVALDRAFGHSDFSPTFWGNYNTIPIDSHVVQLLEKKLLKHQKP